jgi:selenocysteine lyase/cysteine desulfurase
MDRIRRTRRICSRYATDQVNRLPGVRIIGTAERKAAVLSFVVDGVHPHDVGTLLNEEGVAIRTGHHCAQPVMQRFAYRRPPALRSPSTTRWRKSTRWSPASRKVQKMFA